MQPKRRCHRGVGAIGICLIVGLLIAGSLAAGIPADATSTWQSTGPMKPVYGFPQTVLLHDGRALVGGVNNFAVATARWQIYDPMTNQWSQTSPMPLDKGNDAPVVLADGRVLFSGGTFTLSIDPGSTRTIAAAQIYDPVANSWTPVAPMLHVHNRQTTVLLNDGTVLMLGGTDQQGEESAMFQPTSDIERYDPKTNRWSMVPPLAQERINANVVKLADGRVLVAGGLALDPIRPLASAEIYEPATNSWSSAGSMAYPRNEAAAMLLPDGQVLVAGGISGNDQFQATTELYDPATNQWSAGPSMLATCVSQTAASFEGGKVIVYCGHTSPYSPPGAPGTEIYDPAANRWYPGPEVPAGNESPSIVDLQSGWLLFVGGQDLNKPTAEARIYFPVLPGPEQRQLGPGGPLPPARLYFPQTGHYLSGGFRAFWQQFGGLAIFGYPISEEFQEGGVTVQYFERARFEWHPGSNPASYDVELGLVGKEYSYSQASTPPFQRTAEKHAFGCDYFDVTGHNLCGDFRGYWQAHGGLAIFGYPISEPFEQNGETVQYFERARFELPAGKSGISQVQLGRLGVAIMSGTR
ncbi:MAG TPA: kelch repeat-containing protein [Thermomicrobiaceae bacterium]|nr:kelch repeat-containing protein [Thermomicrobiaceae bacterium]